MITWISSGMSPKPPYFYPALKLTFLIFPLSSSSFLMLTDLSSTYSTLYPGPHSAQYNSFASIECFAGFADAIESYLNLSGLEVDDRDRLRHPSMRAKNKKFVMMTGWKIKVRGKDRSSFCPES